MNGLPEKFILFAKECEEESPLYSRLSRGIADDEALLSLAAEAASTPVTNLLFGAVHALLLSGAPHELAGFYPSVVDDVDGGDPFPAFADFCKKHRDGIAQALETRLVQTNEVRRSALLLPVFAKIHDEVGMPLSLVEVGASAGLNLLFDRYAYDYGASGRVGESELTIPCEVRGGNPPVPTGMPEVASRIGLDLSPLDVRDERDTRWLLALIWPEEFAARSALLTKAVEIAREEPPDLIFGDATVTLPDALANIPDGTHPVVFHTFTLNQFPEEARRRLAEGISTFAAEHGPLHELFIGWRPGEPFARIEVTEHPGGEPEPLAECDGHGRWISWSHLSS